MPNQMRRQQPKPRPQPPPKPGLCSTPRPPASGTSRDAPSPDSRKANASIASPLSKTIGSTGATITPTPPSTNTRTGLTKGLGKANELNYDDHVSFSKRSRLSTEFPSEEGPGTSVFYKNEAGEIFHTYSSYGRGLDPHRARCTTAPSKVSARNKQLGHPSFHPGPNVMLALIFLLLLPCAP